MSCSISPRAAGDSLRAAADRARAHATRTMDGDLFAIQRGALRHRDGEELHARGGRKAALHRRRRGRESTGDPRVAFDARVVATQNLVVTLARIAAFALGGWLALRG